MKLNRLEYTQKLFPHFYDRNPQSNFMRHLKVVNNQQIDIYHKLKTLDWARMLEKPIQMWKEQVEPMNYTMYFKVMMPNLKQVNIYKNPIVNNDEEIIGYEVKKSYPNEDNGDFEFYDDETRFFSTSWKDTTKYDEVDEDSSNYHNKYHIIPRDNFVIEVITWDDYRFLKGYPENDYIDFNELDYRFNESYLHMEVEEISYSKYLTFRVHMDKIKLIKIFKNNIPIYIEDFILEGYRNTGKVYAKDFSYKFYDYGSYKDFLENRDIYEIENDMHNPWYVYRADTEKDEYVYRMLLSDEDFDENGVLKDIYDFHVTVFKPYGRCNKDREKTYKKRFSGYESLKGDCFDHDYSLDMIGHLFNVPRFRFDKVPAQNIYYYSRTYPTYENRLTEDDYHYMKRIQYYIQNYNHIYFPVLEFWKYYYTDSELVNRKKYIGEQDNAYLRTMFDSTCLDENGNIINVAETLIDEDFFDDATITEYDDNGLVKYDEESITREGTEIQYHINKATLISGRSTKVRRDDFEWHESIIVSNVFIVPSSNYRLRYGISDYSEPVTLRLEYYNQNGQVISTLQYTPEDDGFDDAYYPKTDGYEYTDTLISIPDDATSVMIVLESNSSFSFTDVTFQKQSIIEWDNKYMKTSYECNSNVYDLYVDYHNIPSNIRLYTTEQFNLLFNRSLPLTKHGYFHLYINEGTFNTLELSEEVLIEILDYFGADERTHSNDNRYEFDINYGFIDANHKYRFEFTCDNDNPSMAEERTTEFLIGSRVIFKDDFGNELDTYECVHEVDTKIDGTVIFSCIAPIGTENPCTNATWIIESENNFRMWDKHLTREII